MIAKLDRAIESLEALEYPEKVPDEILSDLRTLRDSLGKPVETDPCVVVSELADYDLTTEDGFAGAAEYVRARDAAIRAEGWGDVENRIVYFEEEVAAAIADNNRPLGGQQVSFHGDFARCPTSALNRMLWWAKTFRQELSLPPATKGADDGSE